MESVLILDYIAPRSMIHHDGEGGKNRSKEIASSSSFTAFRTRLAMTRYETMCHSCTGRVQRLQYADALCYSYREKSRAFKGWLIDIDTCAIINSTRASERRIARGKPEQIFLNSQVGIQYRLFRCRYPTVLKI